MTLLADNILNKTNELVTHAREIGATIEVITLLRSAMALSDSAWRNNGAAQTTELFRASLAAHNALIAKSELICAKQRIANHRASK